MLYLDHRQSSGLFASRLRTGFRCMQSKRSSRQGKGVAVGTVIADRPPRRSVRAALPHTALVLDSNGRRNPADRTPVGPWNTHDPALGRARVTRTDVLLDSRPSLRRLRPGLCPLVQQLHGYYGAIRFLPGVRVRRAALGLPGPAPRCGGHPGGLPVLVHAVGQRAWGLRLRGTTRRLALASAGVWPSPPGNRVGIPI